MPYVCICVEGNPDFGGYLSIDKGRSVEVKDGSYFEISNGTHVIDIGSKSKATNNALEIGSVVNARMGGEILGSVAALRAIGDEWSFQIEAYDDDVVEIDVLSKGKKIIGTPSYRITEFTDEALAEVKEHFRKVEEDNNRPRRSFKKIAIGLVMFYITVMSVFQAKITGNYSTFIILGVICALIGIYLVIDGFRKKNRNKKK